MPAVVELIHSFQFMSYIQFGDLEIGKKYKVHEIKAKAFQGPHNNTEFHLRIRIGGGYIILSQCHVATVLSLNILNVDKIYMTYNGCKEDNQPEYCLFEDEN